MAKREKHTSKRGKRKLILFVVEGKSDQDALEAGVTALCRMADPEIEVGFCRLSDNGHEDGGDITAAFGINPRNIKKYIDLLCIDQYLKENGYYPKDLIEVVQVTDLDGAYIPDAEVEEDKSAQKPVYFENKIVAGNRDLLIERNERKRANMDALSGFEEIKIDSRTVPYRIYYFSCNLDHFLAGVENMECADKRESARAFSKDHEDAADFITYFFDAPGGAGVMTYEESWDFIREGNHSLERRTNFNLFVDEIISQINC